ncbi:oxidoreductase [Phlyctema vagabunda]|uniref:Oxidoreductase n=1 Tax=Phlyctema vagabunda TaxID=108571 RepID=A0ABR4PVQ9_9HELO
MPGIKKVAIAGVTGALGPHILEALLNANYEVTVLTRAQKSATFAQGVKVVEVDYESLQSLQSALEGHDAVVSTVAPMAISGQKLLIDAAVLAGVKRFIPSDFGTCSTNPKVQSLPLYASMSEIQKYLQEKASLGQLSWTVVVCGAFLEFVLRQSPLLDFDNHTTMLLDGGNNRLSSTSMANVGKSVAAVFKHSEETKNRVVFVSEIILTQNQILEIGKEVRPDIEWKESAAISSEILKEGLEAAAAGDFGMPTIMKLLTGTAMAGDEYGAAYDKTDNELLGVPALGLDELKKLIRNRLA